MFRSLRNRLILTHILTLLVIVPFWGVILVYVLESQFLLPRLAIDLAGEAQIFAQLTAGQPAIWNDAQYAQRMVAQVSPEVTARVMLMDAQGRLLASSDPQDSDRIGAVLDIPGLQEALSGLPVNKTNYSQRLHGDVVDVFMPVTGPDAQVLGIVRMSHRYDTVAHEFMQLRFWIIGILFVGMVVGAAFGYRMAVWVSRPISRVTEAISELAQNERAIQLPQDGPSEIHHLVQAVNTLSNRLRVLDASRKQILASVVHEIGRPLASIRSALQLLTRGGKQDPALLDEMLTGIEGETVLLENLLEDMGHLHDQISTFQQLHRETITLKQWLERSLPAWQATAQASRVIWQTDIPYDLPLIQADPLRLKLALGNLVDNALKYTPPGGQVSLSAGAEPSGIWIQVSDTGPGISPAEQAHIFTPFYRITVKDSPTKGMGLGLSIAREIVEAHGGTLEVASASGQGSQFTIRLPKS